MSNPAYQNRQAAIEPRRIDPSLSPLRLRAVAHIYGVNAPAVERARVLSIGCGTGEGLLPFVLANPEAYAIGIDPSEKSIIRGRRSATSLGVDNLDLRVQDIAQLDPTLGEFDYIVVSGVYSYLPTASCEDLLQRLQECLAPNGVLYVDHNVYPGAKALEVVRDGIMLHAHAAHTADELTASAAAALTLFTNGLSATNPTERSLAVAATQFSNALASEDPAMELQRLLSCNPTYFVEFSSRAADLGLTYVGDAQPLSEIPLSFGQNVSLSHSLLTMGQPAALRQQYLDFASGRTFRQSLLMKRASGAPSQPKLDLSRLHDLRWASGLIRLAANGQKEGVTYVNHMGSFFTAVDPCMICLLDCLAQAWPGSVPYSTLLAIQVQRQALDEPTAQKALDKALQTLMGHDHAHYCLASGPYDGESTHGWRSLPHIRLSNGQENDSPLPLFNLWHEQMVLEFSERHHAMLCRLAQGCSLDEIANEQYSDCNSELAIHDWAGLAELLSLLKRYALATGSAFQWAEMLRNGVLVSKAKAPFFGLYTAALARLSMETGVLTQNSPAGKIPGSLIPQANRLQQLIRNQAWSEAEQLARHISKTAPRFFDAWEALAVVLNNASRPEESLIAALHMLDITPANPQCYIVLASSLAQIDRTSEAIGAGRRAVELAPNDPRTHTVLADALSAEWRYAEAHASCLRALSLAPDYERAQINLSKILIDLGDSQAAAMAARDAIALNPRAVVPRSNLLFAMNYAPDATGEEVFQAYRDFDESHWQLLRSTWKPHKNSPQPTRRLKVGYVSPDFRKHSGNQFVEPLLANRDRSQFELTAYAELTREDEVTARIKPHFDHWVPTASLTDAAMAELIRSAQIDILVDLAGHTVGNRLGVFARKPAPVSLTWLGYGYTTGLSAIDYIATDASMAPPGSEALFSETPWRMRSNLVYQPNDGMGNVGDLPALKNGYITLGTLTRAIRINHRTIRVWSILLKRIPNARLVINSSSYRDAASCTELANRFAAMGIERERLLIGWQSPPWDVLRSMDIGLDCFPHNSGVTLVETLYMGVPYISLADRPSVGRVGSSILQAAGYPEWISNSEEEYIEKVIALASDLPALADIRATLRPQLEVSALMDQVGFTRNFEASLREMFKKWCDTQA